MKRIRAIHPSAAMFVGVLIAFTLPFGYSAQSCGATTKEYRGADLLVGHVQSDGDDDYAAAVSHRGLVWSWLLIGATLLGLRATILRRGRLWGTWCAVAATLALLLWFLVIDAGEPYIGLELAFLLPAGGAILKLLIFLGRWLWREVPTWFAPSVTTPDEPAVR
jgi:hypothetical protein